MTACTMRSACVRERHGRRSSRCRTSRTRARSPTDPAHARRRPCRRNPRLIGMAQRSVAPQDPAAARGISRRTQSEIYRAGISGTKPRVPVDAEALERAARRALSAEAFAYIAGGAGAERTVAANRAAFDRWQIWPRPAARRLDARPLDRLPRPATPDATAARTAGRHGDGPRRRRPRRRAGGGIPRHPVHPQQPGIRVHGSRCGMPRRPDRACSSSTGRPRTNSMHRCCAGPRHPAAKRSW